MLGRERFELGFRANPQSARHLNESRRYALFTDQILGDARNRTILKETKMKDSTKDQAQGKLHEMKGKIKEKVGHATDNPDLEAEGQDEKVAGKIQKKA